MNWIFIDDRGINLDHVTDVRFCPASTGTDDETAKPFNVPAHIFLWMTSTEMEKEAAYDGDVMGVAATSRCHSFKGQVAEEVWKQLQRKCSMLDGSGVPMVFTSEVQQ